MHFFWPETAPCVVHHNQMLVVLKLNSNFSLQKQFLIQSSPSTDPVMILLNYKLEEVLK